MPGSFSIEPTVNENGCSDYHIITPKIKEARGFRFPRIIEERTTKSLFSKPFILSSIHLLCENVNLQLSRVIAFNQE